MEVFVLIYITYDYYRFKKNHGVFTSIEEAKNHAEKIAHYTDVIVYNGDRHKEKDSDESTHWQIQRFTLNEGNG